MIQNQSRVLLVNKEKIGWLGEELGLGDELNEIHSGWLKIESVLIIFNFFDKIFFFHAAFLRRPLSSLHLLA